MSKHLAVHSILFLVLSMPFYNTQADSVHICDDTAEFAPYIYRVRTDNQTSNTQLTGATTEFLDEIFKVIGIDYKIDLLPWKRCLFEVEHFGSNNNYEVFTNGSYSQERSEKYYTTSPIYKTHEGLWYSTAKYPEGISVQSAKDFNQYRLCGVLGYNYEFLSNLGITAKITTGAKSVKSALIMLSQDRCDIFVGGLEDTHGGSSNGIYSIPKSIVGIQFPRAKENSYHIFVSKESPRAYELLTKLNQAILLLQHQGIATKIYDKYLPNGNGL